MTAMVEGSEAPKMLEGAMLMPSPPGVTIVDPWSPIANDAPGAASAPMSFDQLAHRRFELVCIGRAVE